LSPGLPARITEAQANIAMPTVWFVLDIIPPPKELYVAARQPDLSW
jgi:hypothetical protein